MNALIACTKQCGRNQLAFGFITFDGNLARNVARAESNANTF
jgi:hypothetical protein